MPASAPPPISIDEARLWNELERLAAFSEQPAPAVTRVLFTETDLNARAYVRRLAQDAGLVVRVDPVGNMFMRLEGADPKLPPIGTGSHIDAIPNGGKYDGTVGVLGGIAALRALRIAGRKPPRALEVVAFTAEEPTRFGLGCVGSRLMSGAISPRAVAALRDEEGRGFDDVRLAAGFTGDLERVRLNPGHFAAFVELHVEQGPLLEAEGVPIGVVTSIAAPASYALELKGVGGHAGALTMAQRRDAFTAACEIALAVERAARQSASTDTVATCGVCRLFPGAINSVPAQVHLEIDLRDTEIASRDAVFARIEAAIEDVRWARGVSVETRTLNADPPAVCATRVVHAVESVAARQGLRSRRMVSRAYHDALFLSRMAPTGMIFIPSRAGVSHRPDEYTSPEEIAQGASVLAETLWDLAHAPPV